MEHAFTRCEVRKDKVSSFGSGTAERNFVWGGYSPFLKSLLCAKLKSTIYGKIIGGAIAPLAPLLRGPCGLHQFTMFLFHISIISLHVYNIQSNIVIYYMLFYRQGKGPEKTGHCKGYGQSVTEHRSRCAL